MKIPPPSSGNTPRTSAGRLGNTDAVRPERKPNVGSDSTRSTGDRIELSPDALALQQRTEIEPTPLGELTRAQLQSIGERLASGHYERPEVQEAVLRGLIRELDAALE